MIWRREDAEAASGQTPPPPPQPRDRKDKQMADNGEVTIIGVGARLEGNVVSAGNLRIDGQVKGQINADGVVARECLGRTAPLRSAEDHEHDREQRQPDRDHRDQRQRAVGEGHRIASFGASRCRSRSVWGGSGGGSVHRVSLSPASPR